MSLSEQQRQFSAIVGLLLHYLPILSSQLGHSYEVTLGDAFSKAEFAVHSLNSFHYKRLAIDLNLFIDGIYQTTTEAHKPLGEFWQLIGGSWGGLFPRKDGNHYSLNEEEEEL